MKANSRAIPRFSARGFTLIEMMLALIVGTMILTAASAVFVSTMDAWRRGSRSYAQTQAADKIPALIERHLRAALSPAQDKQAVFLGEDLSLDEGHVGHRLTLISSAPGRFPRNLAETDAAEIAFEYDPSKSDGMSMRIQCPPDNTPDDGGYLVGLSPLIVGFRVIYFDGEKWKESWSGSKLPQAVEFTLLFDRAATAGSAAASQSDGSASADPGATGPAAEDAPPGTGPLAVSRLVWLPAAQADADSQSDSEQSGAAGANPQQQGAAGQGNGQGGGGDASGGNGAPAGGEGG